MRAVWIFWMSAAAVLCQEARTVRQGDAILVSAGPAAATARMNGRTVPLFAQRDAKTFGLMPVPVLERPGKYVLEVLDAGGGALETLNITVLDARFRRQNITLGKATAELKPSTGEMESVRALRETTSPERHWAEPLVAPLPGCLTSPFGVLRMHNGRLTGGYHGGVDQRGPEGEVIRAVASGQVRLVRMFNIHGGTVGIDHGQGLTSIYLHMSKFSVAEGDAVRKGDPIGYVGSTGRSTAPHLHWGLSAHGVHVNPMQWVRIPPCASPKKAPARKR